MDRRAMLSLRVASLLFLVTVTPTACTTNSSASPDDTQAQADAGPTVTCQQDPRVDTYVANLTKASASGQLKVTLVSSDPAPPLRGTNTWSVKVADGSGNPVANANLTVTPFMPDHNHGTSVSPSATAKGDGTYEISSLFLFMPGVWKVTIANGSESVDFFFCVAG
jgi:hypothetical protein